MTLQTIACCACLTLLLAACDRSLESMPAGAAPTSSVEQAASNKQLAESFGSEFTDTKDEPQKPSYEVAIATAAADQTRGLEACREKPAAEQKTCKEEVDKAWAEAAKAAEGARGTNQ